MISWVKRILVIGMIGLLPLGAFAQGTTWSFLPKAAGKLKQALVEGNHSAALRNFYEWAPSEYGRGPTGQALYAYLLMKNGLTLSGIETLFLYSTESAIPKELRSEIKSVLPWTHKAWTFYQKKVPSSFSTMYPNQVLAKVRQWQTVGVQTRSEAQLLKSWIPKYKHNEEAYSFLAWPLALWASLHDENLAEQLLVEILASDQKWIDNDRVSLAYARVLYQKGHYKEAINIYKQVPKHSDYWLEALEEIAWAYLRLGQPHNSLAQLKTILDDLFLPILGPEPFYLSSYIQLKLCHHKDVFELINKFKEKMRERANHIQNLANGKPSVRTQQALKNFEKGNLSLEKVGPDVVALPRLFHRDSTVQTLVWNISQRRKELAEMSAFRVSQDVRNVMNKNLAQSERDLQNRVWPRLKTLAQGEVKEFSKMLQRLQILEAENIQRLYQYQVESHQFKGDYKKKIKGGSDVMVFPQRGDEVWLDELGHFQVNVEACPTEQEVKK